MKFEQRIAALLEFGSKNPPKISVMFFKDKKAAGSQEAHDEAHAFSLAKAHAAEHPDNAAAIRKASPGDIDKTTHMIVNSGNTLPPAAFARWREMGIEVRHHDK